MLRSMPQQPRTQPSSGELAILAAIAAHSPRRAGVELGIGDDAAVLTGAPPLVAALDMVVDGVHFRMATASPADIGHKALAVNLSDLAAMGATPVAALVGLGVPADVTDQVISAIYEGMDELAAEHGVTIAGGDVSRAPALTLAVTALGRMDGGRAPVRRDGAAPGDVVCVTGALGAAAAGLAMLDDPALSVPEAEALRAAHLRPRPRVAAGMALADAGASAMLDCSDGFALDLTRLAEASNVAVAIALDRLPRAPGVDSVATKLGLAAEVLAATGGEDYELIVTLPAAAVAAAQHALDLPLTPVGRVTAGTGVTFTRSGAPVALSRPGWLH